MGNWRNTLAGLSDQISDVSKPCAICEDAPSFIIVDSATISIDGDLPAGTTQDATEWFQAACNDLQTCDFKLAAADFAEPGPFTLVDVNYRCGSNPTVHSVSISGAGNPQLSEGAYVHLDCAPRIAKMQATFRGQAVQQSNSSAETDVSTHSSRGPSIPKLNDDVFAPPGTGYNSSTYSVVLPQDETVSALFIDLGSVVTLCGGMDCTAPQIQASSADVFQLDTSADGASWYDWNLFPAGSGSGLQTRSSIPEPRIDARYVRVWARPGDGKYGISELQLYSIANNVVSEISGHIPSFGPEPLITNG